MGFPEPGVAYWIQVQGSPKACIVAKPPANNPPETGPIYIAACEASGNMAKWTFEPIGNGRFYIYSLVMGSDRTRRLDFVQPDGMPTMVILGPSDSKYNNQQWDISSPGRFTSYGRPGALLTTAKIGNIMAAVMQESSSSPISGNVNWNIAVALAANSDGNDGGGDSSSSSQRARQSTPITQQPSPPQSRTMIDTITSPTSDSAPLTPSSAPSSSPKLSGSSSLWGLASSPTTLKTQPISPSPTSSSTSPLPPSPTNNLGQQSTSLSAGAIVGIVFGGLSGIAICWAIFFYLKKLRNRRRTAADNEVAAAASINNTEDMLGSTPLVHMRGGSMNLASSTQDQSSPQQSSRHSHSEEEHMESALQRTSVVRSGRTLEDHSVV